jgi:rhamnosyltransferase
LNSYVNKNTEPKIAVLLAAYNGLPYLPEQLSSILTESNLLLNIWISVDSSSDGTEAWVDDCNLKNRQIIILPHGQVFNGASANFFRLLRDIDLGDIDYIALSDQDDLWQSDKLNRAVQVIEANDVDAYSSNVTAFWPDGTQKLINKAQPQQEWDYMFESAGPGCTFVMTKKLALAVQKFLIENQQACTQVALHDWFIYAFARSRGYKWFIDDESHMLYRQHAENVVGANVGVKAKLARWKKLREGWLIKQALLIANLLGYTDAWPIKKLERYSFLDRLILILNIKKLRRRLRDRIALALFLILPLRK